MQVITAQNVRQIEEELVLPDHSGTVLSHAFSANRKWLALGVTNDSGSVVELYDLQQGQLVGTISTVSNGAEDLAFHPTAGTLIITSGNNPSFEIWDPVSRRMLKSVAFPVGHQPGRVAVTSSGQTVITGGFDGQVLIWNWNGGNPTLRSSFQAHSRVQGEPGPFISDLALSNDSTWLATSCAGEGYKVWRMTFDGYPEEHAGSDTQAGWVHSVGFDRAATRLAAACDGQGGRLHLVDLPSGRLVAALSDPEGVQNQQMISCAVAPNEALVASAQTAQAGCLLQFWSTSDGAKQYSVSVLCDRIGFSHDGDRLLVVRNQVGSDDVPTLWGIPQLVTELPRRPIGWFEWFLR
jgi:hypothetical protein